jgi:thermospermine synthase
MVGAVQEGIVREMNGGFEVMSGYDRSSMAPKQQQREEESKWYEEEIDDDLKLCYALNSVLHRGASKYQEIALIDTKHFGKALIIDGKMQSTEVDEFIYHESLIHPPLLFHPNPKTVFIMGGGEGSAAREVLRHNTVHRVVMCDIDQEVVDFCRTYLTVNWDAFASDKLCLIINDARYVPNHI